MAFTKVTTGGLSQTSNYLTHNVNSTGIITAVKFVGDGSELDGVSSAGIGTALDSEDTTSPLNVIYYTDSVLGIGSTMVINHPNSAVAAYTPYTDIKIEGTADLIVSDGDDFVVDVLGIGTTGSASSQSGTGGRVRAGELTNTAGTGAPDFPLGATVTGFITATNTGGLKVGTAITISSGVVTATKFVGDGSSLSGLASREIYGFTGIGSHLRLTYSNNGADNISGTDFAAFEDEFIGPSGITWSINNDGNLIATI